MYLHGNPGLPSTCAFAPNHTGAEDVAIFDFSKKQQSVTPFKIVGEQEGNKLLVALVGDALIEPFWPLGTGANRAILSALDTTWMVKGITPNTPACRNAVDINSARPSPLTYLGGIGAWQVCTATELSR
jgi:hypothetical protein